MNDLTKMIFEKLEVKVNEEFMIKGYTNPFIISDKLQIYVKDHNINGNYAQWEVFTIASLILGYEEIIKLPKPLLTEEEKQWLKGWKVSKVKKEEDINYGAYIVIYNGNIGNSIPCSETKFCFKGLENEKEYTPEELGI